MGLDRHCPLAVLEVDVDSTVTVGLVEVGDLEDPADLEEAGVVSEEVAVELDDLGVAGAVVEVGARDRPERLARTDRVWLGRWALPVTAVALLSGRAGFLVVGPDVASVAHGPVAGSGAERTLRSRGRGVCGLGCGCWCRAGLPGLPGLQDGGRGDEQERRGGDEVAGCALGQLQAR